MQCSSAGRSSFLGASCRSVWQLIRVRMRSLFLILVNIAPCSFLCDMDAGFSATAQQVSFASSLQGKLDRYYAVHTPVILDMAFNQPAYVPGDTVWFSQWLITEKEAAYVSGRQIVHLVIMSRGGTVVVQQNLLMKDGLAHGHIVVPMALAPGIYTVISWTDWMANGSREMYCYRELIINDDQTYSTTMSLGAYPESGRLVMNVPNRIAVTGNPRARAMLSARGQILQSATLDEEGYGEFNVVPDSSIRYTVSSGQRSIVLAKAHDEVAMTLHFYDTASMLRLELHSPVSREGCQLVILARGRMGYSAMVDLRKGRAEVVVPRKALPEGLVLATLFDKENNVLSERLLVANTSSYVLQADAPAVVRPRDRVSVSVAGRDVTGPVMISVFATDLFHERLSGPGLSAMLPFSAIDFKMNGSWSLQKWNSFLTTQKWSRFKWSQVFANTVEPKYPVGKYLRFRGRVSVPSGETLPDSARVTFFMRGEARIYEESVAPNGEFDMVLFFDYYDREEVIYTVDRKGVIIPGANVEIERDSISPFFPTASVNTISPDRYAAFALLRESAKRAYANYDLTTGQQAYNDPNAAVEDELFKPDVTVRLDDYILFPTMEETLREIVPGLQHRWRGKQHTVRVALQRPDILATQDPMYFIDGVPTDDTNYFMSLDPQNVATIKIVTVQDKLRSLGILGRSGVVFVTTKIADHETRVPRTSRSFTSFGLTRPLQFVNVPGVPVRTPLLRSTACFEAGVVLDSKGIGEAHFTVPDNIGNFTIRVIAHAKDGTRVETFKNFRAQYLAPQ